MTDPQFWIPLEETIARARDLRNAPEIEVKQHMKMRNDGWESYPLIERDALQIEANVRLVVQGADRRSLVQPKVPPLPLPPGKE